MTPSLDSRYVPFLKGKDGEFRALEQLSVDQRQPLTPLLDVPPEKIEFERVDGTKWIQIQTVDQALDGYAAKIARAWGCVDLCFVDLAGFDPSLRLVGGEHPLTGFFSDAKTVGLAALPVTGLDRDPAQVHAVKRVCEVWRLGAAIRLRRPALADPPSLAVSLPKLLKQIDQEVEQVDLLLDFGELIKSNVEETAIAARRVIEALPALDRWRSLILCSGAFPFRVGDFVGKDESDERPRRDWQLWQRLTSSSQQLPRLPSFGDYGASRADWDSPFDPTEMSVSAKIVYATDKDWVIVKGRVLGSANGPQFYGLAAKIKARKEFLDRKHCPGEEKIIESAAGRGGPGNLGTWVTVATRHHIEVVTRQLASLS